MTSEAPLVKESGGRRILLAKMGSSVFNRSIWEGLARGFRTLGHLVSEHDGEKLPDPRSLEKRPDLLLAVHGGNVPGESVRRYRDVSIPTAVYLLDEPYEVDRSTSWSRHYDWVFSVDEATVQIHAGTVEDSRRAVFLPLGFDSERFTPDGKAYASEILVLGSPFEHRLRLLAPLRARFGRHITWVGPGWRPFCPDGHHVDQWVTPEVCARFYRGARFVINIHRDPFWSHFGSLNSRRIAATHLNPRFWEAAACAAFQLCSSRTDISRFAPSTPTFDSADALEELLIHFWDRQEEREAIARRTRASVSAHSYVARAEKVASLAMPTGDRDARAFSYASKT